MTDITALIVSWNDWPKLRVCLRSLLRDTVATMTVIVVDNGSTDGTPDGVASVFPEVQLIRNNRNLGHTRAVNQGFKLACGRYVLLLDSDTELLEGCLARLYEFMEARPDVAMAAPRTYNTDGTIQESARNFPTPLSGLFGRQSTLTRLFPGNRYSVRYLQREQLDARAPFRVAQIGGACMFFRRELIDSVGCWDEGYLGYWVDTDWCRRLQKAGQTIVCVPSAQLRHAESNARSKVKTAQRIWMFHAGAWRFYTRWHTFGPLDPRAVAAGAALCTRAGLKIALNAWRRRRLHSVAAAKPPQQTPAG